MRASSLALGVLLLAPVLSGSCDSKKSPVEPSCTFTVSPSSLAVGSSGGTATVTVTTPSNCTWTATVDVTWLAITAGSSGKGSGTVSLLGAANTTPAVRTGTLVVAGHSVVVTQEAAGAPCAYSVSPTAISAVRDGGTGSLTVTAPSGCAWTAASAADWLTISSGSQGVGSGAVAYSIARNDGGTSRQTTLVVAGQSIPAVQSATSDGCVTSVTPDSSSFDQRGGTGVVTIAALGSCAWTATSGASWLTLTGGTSGQGNGTVTYLVEANADAAGRETAIDIGGLRVAIAQSGNLNACEYSVAPTTFTPCMVGSSRLTSSIATSAMCPWSATSDAPWITVTHGDNGTGPGQVDIAVGGNYDAPRTGQVLVRWPTPTAGQNVRVVQAGCRYAVTQAAFGFSSSGGRGTFDVLQQSDPIECGGPLQNACAWTATTDAPWITITNGHPTSGDGTVSFSVATNTGAGSRSATIVVRDKRVQVTQSGSGSSGPLVRH